ncbi:MAG: HAD family hydrolase [Candidatus Dormibacteraeota bacterium]|uniref:HAD family hydrolase n=1 Tax=Candidatus Dormiibacter inghamiae TaxID=3127013 RepID=A0A934NGT8_9BACT|nr:HAD family hydrolase [Candidatus Dormibacteraeota bacterium]MBJ7605675.1 HAD family hydrolase [Candidatus Dormibacteraeota bacterium]
MSQGDRAWPVAAVVFDYGQTLVTFDYPRACLLQVLKEVAPWLGPYAPPPEWLLKNVLEPLEAGLADIDESEVDYFSHYQAGWQRVGQQVPAETLWRIMELEQACWARAVRPAPTAFATLRALRQRGYRLGIASNAPFPPELLHRQLALNGFSDLVDAVVFSSEIGKRKPAKELYVAALAKLQVEPGRALYIGDKPREDYHGPCRAGLDAIICTELTDAEPPPPIPFICKLSELLERLP